MFNQTISKQLFIKDAALIKSSNRIFVSFFFFTFFSLFTSHTPSQWSQISTINTPQLNAVKFFNEFTGIKGHQGHVGGDTARCIMHRDIDNNMVWPYFTFCDNHACYIFAHVNDSDWYRPQAAGNKPTMQLNNELEVNISLDKSIYLEGENITLGLEIRNITDKNIVIKEFYRNMSSNFTIKNSIGVEAKFIGLESISLTSQYDTLKAGELKSYRYFLLDEYSTKIKTTYYSPGSIYGLLEEGNYTIVFSKMLDNKGALVSNSINFIVEKPKKEEISAFSELIAIYPMITKGYWPNKINRYREFIYKFPESLYMDQAFYCMIWLEMAPCTNEHTFEDCNWFITRKPNSSVIDYAFWGIEYVFEKEKDSNGFKNYLQEIMNKHPDTKASALAQKFLADKFKK